jgi:hypothetical protein
VNVYLCVQNIGLFVERLADIDPELMTQHLALLTVQIDSPAFQIRSSLLQAMGRVLAYIHGMSEQLTSVNTAAGSLNGKRDYVNRIVFYLKPWMQGIARSYLHFDRICNAD